MWFSSLLLSLRLLLAASPAVLCLALVVYFTINGPTFAPVLGSFAPFVRIAKMVSYTLKAKDLLCILAEPPTLAYNGSARLIWDPISPDYSASQDKVCKRCVEGG